MMPYSLLCNSSNIMLLFQLHFFNERCHSTGYSLLLSSVVIPSLRETKIECGVVRLPLDR
jgi:hypothetical protein